MKRKEKRVTDVALVKQCQEGSMEAYEELMSRYESKAYNLAMRFLRNPEDTEEVLQDVFATIYRKIGSFEGKSAFSSWLYRIVVNAAFMKLRKRKQQPTVSLEDLSPTVRQSCLEDAENVQLRSDTISTHRELRDVLEGAINRLPEQYRAVFVLRDVDGLSNTEVGEILSISIPAVKSRLHRSRLMLRKKLLRFYEEFQGKPYTSVAELADLVANGVPAI